MSTRGWLRFGGLLALLTAVLAYGASTSGNQAGTMVCEQTIVSAAPECYASAWWWNGPL